MKIKINTRLAFGYYPNGNEMDQMVRNDIACICIPIDRIAFWHTFHFNCFFEDFNCVFTQIRCLSRVLDLHFIVSNHKDESIYALRVNVFEKYVNKF